MSMRLIDSLATTPALAELFSDESVLSAMLDFESALARAEARTGVIPKNAADIITALAKPGSFDPAALSLAAFRAGTPCNPSGEGADGASTKNQRGSVAFRPLGRNQPGCRR